MPTAILTNVAEEKINLAAGTNNVVAITHVALGDGRGSNYNPSNNQSALRNELARKEIDRRHTTGQNGWRVKVEFGPETDTFFVREIGFFDADGDLIALYAGTDIDPRQTGAVTYLIDHVLNFSRVADGLVIVDAPNDELFDLAIQTGISVLGLQKHHLNLEEKVRSLT